MPAQTESLDAVIISDTEVERGLNVDLESWGLAIRPGVDVVEAGDDASVSELPKHGLDSPEPNAAAGHPDRQCSLP